MLADVTNPATPRTYRFVAREGGAHYGWASTFVGGPEGVTSSPQGQFGTLHDIIDHAELGHEFTRAGEIRAFGSMFFRRAMDNPDSYPREMAAVLSHDLSSYHASELLLGYLPYLSPDVSVAFKLMAWEVMERLCWPYNLTPRETYAHLCEGYERAAQWWDRDQWRAQERCREMQKALPPADDYPSGAVLVVTLHGGSCPSVTHEVELPAPEPARVYQSF